MNLLSAAEIAEDRRTAEANMPDRCRVTRAAVSGDAEYVAQVLDEDTGQYPAQGRVTVYEGRCRLQIKSDINSNVVETTAGEREWTYLTSTLQTPMAAVDVDAVGNPANIRPDHVCVMLAVPNDTSLVDREFNVQGAISHKSQSTHRRFRIREVAS